MVAGLAAVLSDGCVKSPAEEALARCERAGEVHAAAQEAHQTEKEHYDALRERLQQQEEQEHRVPQLRELLRQAEPEFENAVPKILDPDSLEFVLARAFVRGHPNMYPGDSELRATVRNLLNNALWDIEEEIDQETVELRKIVDELRRREEFEEELLDRMIEEANALREPGVPLCRWQFG